MKGQDQERGDEDEVEWGVWLDRPNGYSELQTGLNERDARVMAAWHNDSGKSTWVASIVTRRVSYSEWQPVSGETENPK